MYSCLQPLMICLSYNGTIAQIKHAAKEFDAAVFEWSESLIDSVQVCIYLVVNYMI